MRVWACLLLLWVSACSRCGSNSKGADASGARIRRSTDLRAAMISSFPEYRGVLIVSGEAALVRTLDRPIPLEGELLETIRGNGFNVLREGNTILAKREPFVLKVDGMQMTISLPMHEGDLEKMLGAPTPMTTEQLATWFPSVPSSRVLEEHFYLQLKYRSQSAAWRAGYLAWQVVDLGTRGNWRVKDWPAGYEQKRHEDGGAGETPEVYSLQMTDLGTEAQVKIHRDGTVVDVRYELQTQAP